MFDWLQNEALKRMAGSAIRHGLTALGATLVARGYTTDADWSSIALDLSPLLVSVVWSLLNKVATTKKMQTMGAALEASAKG